MQRIIALEMNEEFDALECTIDALLIHDLILLLQDAMPNRLFHPTSSNFYRDRLNSEAWATRSVSNDTDRQCNEHCALDMHEFVLQEAAIGLKNTIASFSSMLDGKLPLRALRNFGFAPVYNTLSKLRLHQSQFNHFSERSHDHLGTDNTVEIRDDDLDYRIEAGGGSGMGFQLLCDGRQVMTAGGGGGGKKECSL